MLGQAWTYKKNRLHFVAGSRLMVRKGYWDRSCWFESLRAALEGNPGNERTEPRRRSTNLLNPSRVCPITQRELQANTFPYNLNSTDPLDIKHSREWLSIICLVQNEQARDLLSCMHTLTRMKTKVQPFSINCPSDGKRKQAKITELIKFAALLYTISPNGSHGTKASS